MLKRWRMSAFAPIALVLAAVAVVWVSNSGCYPDYGLTYSDYDVVATFYDTTVDFNTFTTFYMPDTIFQVGDTSRQMDDRFDDELLTDLRSTDEPETALNIILSKEEQVVAKLKETD